MLLDSHDCCHNAIESRKKLYFLRSPKGKSYFLASHHSSTTPASSVIFLNQVMEELHYVLMQMLQLI